MVNIKSILVSAALIAAGSVVFANPAQAAECKIDPVTEGDLTRADISDPSSNTTLTGKTTITTKLVVRGDEDCEKSASIGVWKMPSHLGPEYIGLPLSDQVLFNSVTGTFGPGEHTLSIDVPACYWQADVMEGTRATAADGSADYQIGDPSDPNTDRFLDVAYGGNSACFGEDNVENPETPVTPAVSQEITSLPNTGLAGSASAVATSVISIVTAAGYSLVRKFKK